MCECVCVCVCVTQLNYKRITCLKCLSFYGCKQAVSLRLERVSQSMYILNVCEAHPCCCFSLVLIHTGGSVLPLRRNWVKERKGVWRRRIYRKYTSCKRLQTQDENLRADVVLSRSRGSPGQWFPENEYVSVRHLCANKWHTAQIKL